MSSPRVIHWKAGDSPGTLRALGANPPAAVVIDLSRLPSQGREATVFLRGQKATRHIPMVFVGGDPAKVAGIRKLLPDAVYTQPGDLPAAIEKALAARPADPVVPVQMMARYANRTTAQKLGIRENSTVAVIDPPRDYAHVVGELPSGAQLQEAPATALITLWFVHDAAGCAEALPNMRALSVQTRLWILWRKGSAVTQPFLRKSAAALGLVDYKICSVNSTWSAMLFTLKI